ncbi:MAG: UbiX family flavin prenyltransferase [Spirochaetota bacterium]
MIVVGITGASGVILGIRLIESLLEAGREVAVVVTDAGWEVMAHEMGKGAAAGKSIASLLQERGITGNLSRLKEYHNSQYSAPPASGTGNVEAVVIVPCSMKSLASVAHGYADSLLHRACDVALKERRKCVLVPRETPLSLIHVENMRAVLLAGAILVPPVPAFYSFPETVDDIINFIIGKILHTLDIPHTYFKPWGQD